MRASLSFRRIWSPTRASTSCFAATHRSLQRTRPTTISFSVADTTMSIFEKGRPTKSSRLWQKSPRPSLNPTPRCPSATLATVSSRSLNRRMSTPWCRRSKTKCASQPVDWWLTGFYAVSPCTRGNCGTPDLQRLAAALEEAPVSFFVDAESSLAELSGGGLFENVGPSAKRVWRR